MVTFAYKNLKGCLWKKKGKKKKKKKKKKKEKNTEKNENRRLGSIKSLHMSNVVCEAAYTHHENTPI